MPPQRQTPFETHCHVGQDTEDGGQHGQRTVCRQFITHGRADKLDAFEHCALVELLGRRQHFVTLLFYLDPLFRGQAEQHVTAGAKVLQGCPFNLLLFQSVVDLVQAHRLLEPHLDGGTTGKVQTPVQPPIKQEEQGYHHQHGRENHTRLGIAHKRDRFFKM